MFFLTERFLVYVHPTTLGLFQSAISLLPKSFNTLFKVSHLCTCNATYLNIIFLQKSCASLTSDATKQHCGLSC